MNGSAAVDLLAEALVRRCPAAARIVYFDAVDISRLRLPPSTSLTAIQPWRPAYDRLIEQGYTALPDLGGTTRDFDAALVLLGRQRARSLARIAEAVAACRPDGLLIVAGSNDLGPTTYARRLRIAGSASRAHARVFWATARDAVDEDERRTWIAAGRLHRQGEADHHAAPGLFAWDRVDEGSALLAQHLPAAFSGTVADLGAGWGFLARCILARASPGLQRLDLYEADWIALAAARLNLSVSPPPPTVTFHWHDVTRGLPRGGYDTIVMNPPFHDALRADSAIGLAFIAAAHDALRKGGDLWLVANRTLPYEQALQRRFARMRTLESGTRYKVIAATR